MERLEPAACAACGASRSEILFHGPNPDGLSSRPFPVVRCVACGMAYVSPRPAEADLGRYYVEGYYNKPGEDSGFIGRWLGRMFMLERVARVGGRRASGRVLDVGCGEGTFLAAMSRRGWDCWGVEVSSEGSARAAARPGLKIFDKAIEQCGFAPKSFDLVTLWHSIEHVPDPAALLRQVAGLVKDDGRIYLAFPNPESWDFRIFGPRWFHLDPPRHLHYFSARTMTRLLAGCGLKTVHVGQISWEYNPFGFVQSVLNFLTPEFNYMYRKLKGNLPPGAGSLRDLAVTALALPFLTLLSIPYVLAAGAAGASGCIDVTAVKDR